MGDIIEELRKKVMESYKAGDWKSCADACRELHKRIPDNVAITLKLADVFVKSKQKGNAVKAYQKAAETYKKAGDFLKAIGVYKMALQLDPNNTELVSSMEALCSKPDEKDNKAQKSLPNIPLLSELKKDELVEVVDSFKHLTCAMGDIICRAGDEGTSIYIIISGSVKIFIEGVAGEKIEITQLREGDFFGEAGFFSGGKRGASVMAIDDLELLEITREDFEKISASHPRIREVLEGFYKKRVLDKVIAVSPLFSALKVNDRNELTDKFSLENYNEGDAVITEGEAGNALFIIKSGQVKVSTKEGGDEGVALGELKAGDFFGEVSLVTGRPRTATVTALTGLEVMKLSKSDLNKCIEKHPKIGDVLERYMKARVEKTISTIMALKEIEAKEGIV